MSRTRDVWNVVISIPWMTQPHASQPAGNEGWTTLASTLVLSGNYVKATPPLLASFHLLLLSNTQP